MCVAGSAALLADCERLLPGVMRTAHGVAAHAEEVSDESLPWHVASSMLHVLAEAAGTYDCTPGGCEQLQGVASLLRLPALQQSLGCGTTEKARQLDCHCRPAWLPLPACKGRDGHAVRAHVCRVVVGNVLLCSWLVAQPPA